MYSDFAEKKETFCALNNRIFQSLKNDIFFQRSQLMLLAKKYQFFLYLNFIKISLEIMLSDLAEKKETSLTLKNRENRIFAKG